MINYCILSTAVNSGIKLILSKIKFNALLSLIGENESPNQRATLLEG